MELSEYLAQYRRENGLSQSDFASRCGFTRSYISLLEKPVNPKTGKPMIPAIGNLQKIADAMNISLRQLMSEVDNIPTSIENYEEDEELMQCLDTLRRRPEMKMLFDVSKNATKEQIEEIANFIEKLYKPQS